MMAPLKEVKQGNSRSDQSVATGRFYIYLLPARLLVDPFRVKSNDPIPTAQLSSRKQRNCDRVHFIETDMATSKPSKSQTKTKSGQAKEIAISIQLPHPDEHKKLGTGFAQQRPKKWSTGNECIDHILNEGHFNPLLQPHALLKNRGHWRTQLKAAISSPPATDELFKAFHTQWHVCHHRLRELLDDENLLFDFMRAWLPKYDGPSQILYRGENIDRFEANRIGSAWSDKQETAEIFARGLNAMGKGGVVLRIQAQPSDIIAGPSKHSAEWLGENEFTVDTRKLTDIVTVEQFSSNH